MWTRTTRRRLPSAIPGRDIVSYGAPVLPGAMFLLAYYQVKDGENPRTVAIMGLPGCVMYARRTIFDLVLPRIMADDQVTADDLAALGQGGLCLNCRNVPSPTAGSARGCNKPLERKPLERKQTWNLHILTTRAMP